MKKSAVVTGLCLFLAACGSSPPMTNPTAGDDKAGRPTATQIAKNESGMGTIAHDEKTRTDCRKKRWVTGSHLHKSGCTSKARAGFTAYGDFDEEKPRVPTSGARPPN